MATVDADDRRRGCETERTVEGIVPIPWAEKRLIALCIREQLALDRRSGRGGADKVVSEPIQWLENQFFDRVHGFIFAVRVSALICKKEWAAVLRLFCS